MPLQKPVSQMTLPSDLVEVTNGSVPASLLTLCGVISGYAPHHELLMHHTASRAMHALLAAAEADGAFVAPMWATGTGRTYDEQLVAFDGQHYPQGRYLPEFMWENFPISHWAFPVDIKTWPDHGRWKRIVNTAMAAWPGSSNHGWDLAIDFWNITTLFLKWLIKNAIRFGFSAETQSEDWHWRYFAGDVLPKAVLDYEAANTPHPTPGGEDMLAIYQPQGDWWAGHGYTPATFILRADGGIRHAAQPDLDYAADHSIKTYPIKDKDQYEHLRVSSGTTWPPMP